MTDLVKAIAKRLKDQYGAKEVILFGSYATGEETEESDVDLLVIAESQEGFFARQATVRRLLRDFKKKISLSPIILTPGELNERRSRGDQFIETIIETGIRA